MKRRDVLSYIGGLQFSFVSQLFDSRESITMAVFLWFVQNMCCLFSLLPSCRAKETKWRSSGQTPFTLKPKQLAIKKINFQPPKNTSQFKKKKNFTFVSSNFLVRTLHCKRNLKKFNFCLWKHEKTALKSCS